MVNYANGKIYKIESTLGDKIYIGSTSKTQLSQRMTTHRRDYKRWKVGKVRMITSFQLFEEYGVENCKIVLLEDCQCETKDQLTAREAHYIRTLECVNKCIPLRTLKEWYEENKEVISTKQKAYKEANKEAISAKKKEYREANKEVISAKKKEWYEANKERLLAKRRADNANKEAISAKRRANYAKNKSPS